jgi:hypothetical protein
MGFVNLLGMLLGRLRRLLGLATAAAEATSIETGKVAAQAGAPTVAVYAWYRRPDPFLLARRIASVARLNVRLGRKARGSRSRFEGLPAIPKSRLGSKRTRLDADRGPRVLVRKVTKSPGAQIIPFPATARISGSTSRRQLAA